MTAVRATMTSGAVYKRVAVIGAAGAIGAACVRQLSARDEVDRIYAFSRSGAEFSSPAVASHPVDYQDETSISRAATLASEEGPLDLVLVTTGILHQGAIMPEKSLRDLSAENFEQVFAANIIAPALMAKHFLPVLHRKQRAVFAVLSARVGSISDNRLGGWYAYRASKAALNMLVKTAAIEMSRSHKEAIVVALHPGTVDSPLSQPFRNYVPKGQLFTPEISAGHLLNVIADVSPVDGGKCFAWDGTEIHP